MRSTHIIIFYRAVLSAIIGSSLPLNADHAQQPLSEALEQEILVVGKKLSDVKFEFKATKRGEVQKCVVTQHSGDPDLDALPCQVVNICASRGFKKSKQLVNCMSVEWKNTVRTLAERRLLIVNETE